MHILEILKRATPAERREMGEIFLSFSDDQDRPNLEFELDAVMARYRDPNADDLAAKIQLGASRVRALSDKLRADGMGHAQLLEAELKRRGDARSLTEYCEAVTGFALPSSDVV